MSSNSIKILEHRNAIYQGQQQQEHFDGIGLSLTQDFLFNAAIWERGMLHGPTLTVFPSEKILYGDFQNNEPVGIFAYQLSKQCQFYFLFNKNKMQRLIVAIFPNLKLVLQVALSQKDEILYQKQHPYNDAQQKWSIISQLFPFKVPQFMKGYRKFIKKSFLQHFEKEVEEIDGEQYYFGVIGEGLGVKMDYKDICVKSIGYFDENKILKEVGNRLISREKKVREEGIFSKPETLYRYQETRDNRNKKYYRDYFRLGINFKNKFIQFTRIQQIQKQILTFRDTLKNNTTRRIAQQLIEQLDQFQLNDEQPPKVQNQGNRSRHEPPSKMMRDVSIEDLKHELNRTMSQNKKGKSPYKDYDPTPAEMKYVTRANEKVEDVRNRSQEKSANQIPGYEGLRKDQHGYIYMDQLSGRDRYGSKERYNSRDRDISPYNSNNNHNDSYYEQKSKHREAMRKIQYDYENQHRADLRRHQQIQRKQKRYPMQQNLRTYKRQNTSKSPIKPEQKLVRYKYTEENPENGYGHNERIGNQINRPKQQAIRHVSPFNVSTNQKRPRKVTPTRTDRLSSMYDEYQSKANNDRSFHSPERKYNLNHGKGYHFNENQFEKQIGLVRTGRKVQTPKRTISPNRLENKYGASTNDRDRYVEERSPDRKMYRYFDKNR